MRNDSLGDLSALGTRIGLVEAIIPEGKSDPFWAQASREVIAGALTRLPDRDLAEIRSALLAMDSSSLAALVKGTDAEDFFREGNEKIALSIRASLSHFLSSRHCGRGDYVPCGGSANPGE